MKNRLLSFALSVAMIASVAGFALSAQAAGPVQSTVTITGTVADVLTLTVSPTTFSFGTGLNFLGANATYGNCPQANGARYLGPNVVTTVQSNHSYDLTRSATGTFPVGRIFVREHSGFAGCGDTGNGIGLVGGPVTTVSNHAPSANGQDTEFFFFDVHVEDPADSYTATITYTAAVHV